MQDDLANLVFPVLTYGVELRERLLQGARPQLATEQATLKRLLGSEAGRRQQDFAGDAQSHSRSGGKAGDFLGVRYALTCWLDELFVLDSPWEVEWAERTLEAALYRSNDRDWMFWEQARRTEGRPGSDALEGYFLCVMLGFRGQLRGQTANLHEWVNAAKVQLGKKQRRQPPKLPSQSDPTTNVPPLRGREQLQQMSRVASLALVLLVVIVVVLLWR